MDALSEMLNGIKHHPDFKFHANMDKIELNHLCFADDLIVFCRAEEKSISLLMSTFSMFFSFSGLRVNPLKSTCYLSNPPTGLQLWIVNNYDIQLGVLPAKFLGVPLITQKLKIRDCQTLIAKLIGRIDSWTSAFLSFAGRLQLLKSVLHAICSFWSSHFLLPKGIINHIQTLLSRFLWNGNTLLRSKAKVSWSIVTLSIDEGGLGIKDAHEWNKSLILNHLLSIINPISNSLWVKWVKCTILNDSSFWIAKKPRTCSRILRKVMDLWTLALQHLTCAIGNGSFTFFWFDPWYYGRPICTLADDPIISHSGLGWNAKVSMVLSSNGWQLPSSNYHSMLVWRRISMGWHLGE